MKRNYLIPTMFLMLALSCTGKSGNVANMTADTHAKDTATHAVTMLFAGDLMQHGPQIRAAKTANGYDYSDVFARVKPEISAADIAVANFEVTLAGEPYSGYPQFSAPDDYLRASIDAGFDVFTTANNHCCDTRAKGREERNTHLSAQLHLRHQRHTRAKPVCGEPYRHRADSPRRGKGQGSQGRCHHSPTPLGH